MSGRGGDHGSQEEGSGEEGRDGQEAGGEEVREEVVLPVIADPGVERGMAYLLNTGVTPVRTLSPEMTVKALVVERVKDLLQGQLAGDFKVDVEGVYGDEEDENMRVVHEVNEDPPTGLRATVTGTVPVVLDHIVLSIKMESE